MIRKTFNLDIKPEFNSGMVLLMGKKSKFEPSLSLLPPLFIFHTSTKEEEENEKIK